MSGGGGGDTGKLSMSSPLHRKKNKTEDNMLHIAWDPADAAVAAQQPPFLNVASTPDASSTECKLPFQAAAFQL